MARLADRLRANLLTTLTGEPDGRPYWVDKIEAGSDQGFFAPDSATWTVHGGIPTMVAGIRALLMQTLHPGAMAGVHDHSRFREDALGRLAGTVQWLTIVTFGDTHLAREETARVARFHERVRGTYPDKTGVQRPYAANDPELLSWVHIVFADAFLGCHELWGKPIPGGPDAYVREWAIAAELLGIPDPPRSEAELQAQLHAFNQAGVLHHDERVEAAVSFIRNPPLKRSMMPAYRIMFAAAVKSIPSEYRRVLGLKATRLPAIWATGVLLGSLRMLLGGTAPAEEAARARLRRIASAHPMPSA